jgi:hypothetical protein
MNGKIEARRDTLEDLAEREDLRSSKLAEALLETIETEE